MVTCSPGAKAQIRHDNGSRNFVVYSGINIAWWKNIVKGTWRIVSSILTQGFYAFKLNNRAAYDNVRPAADKLGLAPSKMDKIVLLYKMEMHIKTVLE